MFLLSGYLILYCLTLSSHCYQQKNRVCEGSSCFYLYETTGDFLTWNQSFEACSNERLEMTRIVSNQTQRVVKTLLRDVPLDTARQVWIGGRRSTDKTWKFMNGTVFNKTVNEPTMQTGLYCLYVSLYKGSDPVYHADNCDEKTSPSRLLCQYDPSETDQCAKLDFPLGGKCYRKTQFGGEADTIDWYNGQTYCSQSDIQGDIAYSYLDDNTLINNITDLVNPGADSVQLWLGVRRRIWFWKTGSKNDENNKPINYYNWNNGTEVVSSDGSSKCVYIDIAKNYKWLAASCTSPPLKYFICTKNGVDSTTTTKAPTIWAETITSTVITSIHTTEFQTKYISQGFNVSSGGNNDPKPGFIIGAVVGVVVLAVVVGLAVFFVLGKRSKQTSAKQSKAEELQYDDVELDGDNDDVIDPYGVVAAENAEKVEVRHKQAPSGDLYAVSGKQVNKIYESKNEEDKNPEVVYAKPKKKKNQKTKNREENGTAKSGNDVDSEKPSGGETGTGSKHTEHFEAPSGEVYARIIKDGKDTDE